MAALHGLLKGDTSIETSATSSLSSPTTSLCQAQSRDIVTTSRDDLKTSRNTATSSHDTLVVPRDVIDHVAESYLSLYDGTQTDRVGEWSGNQDCDNSVIIVNQVPDNAKNSEHEHYGWIFGKTPKFSKTFSSASGDTVIVTVDKGLITDVSSCGSRYGEDLLRRQYDPQIITKILQSDLLPQSELS